ncbi:hypothetical protein ACWGRF_08230 [Streptomyces zhihengii]
MQPEVGHDAMITASRGGAPAWLVLPLCAVLVLLGLALTFNFKGIPERLHQRQTAHRRTGFQSSYDLQRLGGVWLVLVGGGAFVGTAWELATG